MKCIPLKDGFACRADLYATGAAWASFRNSVASLGRVQRHETSQHVEQARTGGFVSCGVSHAVASRGIGVAKACCR